MGTRSLICVVQDGQYKVAQYGQWDGYPDGQGVGVLAFLTEEMNRPVFEHNLRNRIKFGTKEDFRQMNIRANIAPESQWITMEESDRYKKLFPENSRDTGSKILSIIQNTKRNLILDNSLDFAGDSLLGKDERFSFLDCNPEHRTEKYYPVKHVVTFSLFNLPTKEEFLANFSNDEE